MKIAKRIFLSTIVFALSLNFLSYASTGREGMDASNYPNNVWVYSYAYEDGTYAKNQWKQVWDDWYYFGDDGRSKYNTWADINDKWYYFDNWSRMLHDTTTPDGYTVGPDGAWITE